MEIIENIIKVAISLTLLNVWILRVNKGTAYRGGDAVSMKEEFDNYSLSPLAMYVVGTLKIISAILLLVSIKYKQLELPVSIVIGLLMIGAFSMHIKIKDRFHKAIPSLILLALIIMIITIKN